MFYYISSTHPLNSLLRTPLAHFIHPTVLSSIHVDTWQFKTSVLGYYDLWIFGFRIDLNKLNWLLLIFQKLLITLISTNRRFYSFYRMEPKKRNLTASRGSEFSGGTLCCWERLANNRQTILTYTVLHTVLGSTCVSHE